MEYLTIKQIHVASVVLSGALFLLRGAWMMTDSAMLARRWVKIAPHCIDTVLLVSALTLAIMSSQYPFAQGWLTAKVVALVVYIFFGTIALKRGRTRSVRVASFVAAVLTFSYIVGVAVTRQATVF